MRFGEGLLAVGPGLVLGVDSRSRLLIPMIFT